MHVLLHARNGGKRNFDTEPGTRGRCPQGVREFVQEVNQILTSAAPVLRLTASALAAVRPRWQRTAGPASPASLPREPRLPVAASFLDLFPGADSSPCEPSRDRPPRPGCCSRAALPRS